MTDQVNVSFSYERIVTKTKKAVLFEVYWCEQESKPRFYDIWIPKSIICEEDIETKSVCLHLNTLLAIISSETNKKRKAFLQYVATGTASSLSVTPRAPDIKIKQEEPAFHFNPEG